MFGEHRGFYGLPRIHQKLRAAGHPVGRHRVARLMQRAQLKARDPAGPSGPGAGFQPQAANRCWAGEITYIRTTTGCRYLAVQIDPFGHSAVGWKLKHRMEATLVVEALNRGLGPRMVEPKTLLIHTYQGNQYWATDY